MHNEWETPNFVFNHKPIVYIDILGDIPIPPCVNKGALVGGVSEFTFQIVDLMLLEGLEFTSAIVAVYKSDILAEIAMGGATDCWTKYSVNKIEKMLTGKYRQFTFYAIQLGIETIEETVNEVIKDQMTGESIDLRISLKTVVSGQIYGEIFSAKPLVNSFLKKKSKCNS